MNLCLGRDASQTRAFGDQLRRQRSLLLLGINRHPFGFTVHRPALFSIDGLVNGRPLSDTPVPRDEGTTELLSSARDAADDLGVVVETPTGLAPRFAF